MRFGITMFPTDYAVPPHELAIEAEARGFESVWFPEHSHIPTSRKSPWPGGAELPKWYYDTYDPFVAMGAATVVTKAIKLGTGVWTRSCPCSTRAPRSCARWHDGRAAAPRPSCALGWTMRLQAEGRRGKLRRLQEAGAAVDQLAQRLAGGIAQHAAVVAGQA